MKNTQNLLKMQKCRRSDAAEVCSPCGSGSAVANSASRGGSAAPCPRPKRNLCARKHWLARFRRLRMPSLTFSLSLSLSLSLSPSLFLFAFAVFPSVSRNLAQLYLFKLACF